MRTTPLGPAILVRPARELARDLPDDLPLSGFRMQNFDILTLVFLGLAIFVIYKLRAVLGQRTGMERKPPEMADRKMAMDAAAMPAPNNVVPLPNSRPAPMAIPEPETRLAAFIPKDSPLFSPLLSIMSADSTFDPGEFVTGARAAYEMIVLAFANGDRRMLKDLLSRDVYEGFDAAIKDRESRGEKIETQFVSIDKADILEAQLRGKTAQVTVKFISKIITATRDSAGIIIDGSAEKVADVTDIWTFAREVTARDPNWRLISTESAQ